jgi:DNA polymerase (family X)
MMQKITENDKLPLSNQEIAQRLSQVANLLEEQSANPFRVRAYRVAAQLLSGLHRPVYEIITSEGLVGLERLPGIGHSLARSIERLTNTGRLGLLDRLDGHDAPEHLLATVAGIGPGLAGKIHDQLGIESLQDLEIAAHDGRLAQVPGMGAKRLRSVEDSLAGRFRRLPPVGVHRHDASKKNEPGVSELLDIDQEYRQQAQHGRLPRIAPKLFNPTGEAWLPILHTQRQSRHYTALFSNTARAHELGAVHDWVVIYRDDHGGDGQWTVVTGRFGKNTGRRIVRGREQECSEFYALATGRHDHCHQVKTSDCFGGQI